MDIAGLKEAAEAIKSSDHHALDAYLCAANPTAILSLIERYQALEEALKQAREAFTVEYSDDGRVIAVSYDNEALRPLVLMLDAALSPTNTQADE